MSNAKQAYVTVLQCINPAKGAHDDGLNMYVYRVKTVRNSVKVSINQDLSKEQLSELIDSGYEVTIS